MKDVRIVVLERGWVVVGEWWESGHDIRLENCAVIRRWGTTMGLGEIAENGPTEDTKLDPCPQIKFHLMNSLFSVPCNEENWRGKIK